MDPHLKAMIDAAAELAAREPPPPMDLVPPEMVRAGYRMERQSQNTGAPKDVDARDLQIPGPAGPIPARLYTPAGAPTTTPGLVYFHGGGFVIGDLETHDGHCRRLAEYAGIRVLAVDYRLAPEHPFPAAHDDSLAATKWAFDHAAEIGFDPARIAVGGCSAGGNLAAAMTHDLKDDPKHRLAFQLLLYPWIRTTQLTASREALDGPLLTKEVLAWFDKLFAAGDHPRALLGSAKALAGLPPALVVTAGYDPLKDEGRDYAKALAAAGVKAEHVEYPDMVHDFYLLGDVSPAVIAAAKQTAAALKAGLG